MQLELMKIQHRRIIVQAELDQLKEQETLLKSQLGTSKVVSKTSKPQEQLELIEDDTADEDIAQPMPKKTIVKKAAKPVETLAESDGEDDLDDAFGSESDVKPKIGADEVRALLVKIVRSKGEAGKKKAKSVLTKFTKNQSGLVDHIIAGKHSAVYEALKKV